MSIFYSHKEEIEQSMFNLLVIWLFARKFLKISLVITKIVKILHFYITHTVFVLL